MHAHNARVFFQRGTSSHISAAAPSDAYNHHYNGARRKMISRGKSVEAEKSARLRYLGFFSGIIDFCCGCEIANASQK